MIFENIPGVEIRTANIGDIDFVAKIIIEATKGGTEIFLYERIFGISEKEFSEIIKKILKAEIPGSEFHINDYVLFTYHKIPIYGFCVWEEGKTGKSSSMIKGILLSHAIGFERWQKGIQVLEKFSELEMKRNFGEVIFDSVYKDMEAYNHFIESVKNMENMRNQNEPGRPKYKPAFSMLRYKCKLLITENPNLRLIKINTSAQNLRMQNSLISLGFKERGRFKTYFPRIKDYIPDDESIYYQTEINTFLYD